MRSQRVLSGALTLFALLFATACGGEQQPGDQTTLLVTRDFGASAVRDAAEVPVTNGLTAMRQLQSQAEVETTYGGRFVNAIDGVKGGGGSDWLFYVDGVDADKAGTEIRLVGGETVQWDFHPWQSVKLTGAIVGAYPQPLARRGAEVLCSDDTGDACASTKEALGSAGVDFEAPGEDAVTVHVGTWSELKGEKGVPDVSRPPTDSGVFASFDQDGLGLADAQGTVSSRVSTDAGLVFAYSDGGDLGWVITGTSKAGVQAAADSLDRESLRGRFAVASEAGRTISLPVASAGGDGPQ